MNILLKNNCELIIKKQHFNNIKGNTNNVLICRLFSSLNQKIENLFSNDHMGAVKNFRDMKVDPTVKEFSSKKSVPIEANKTIPQHQYLELEDTGDTTDEGDAEDFASLEEEFYYLYNSARPGVSFQDQLDTPKLWQGICARPLDERFEEYLAFQLSYHQFDLLYLKRFINYDGVIFNYYFNFFDFISETSQVDVSEHYDLDEDITDTIDQVNSMYTTNTGHLHIMRVEELEENFDSSEQKPSIHYNE